jgi:hypothetical protein
MTKQRIAWGIVGNVDHLGYIKVGPHVFDPGANRRQKFSFIQIAVLAGTDRIFANEPRRTYWMPRKTQSEAHVRRTGDQRDEPPIAVR